MRSTETKIDGGKLKSSVEWDSFQRVREISLLFGVSKQTDLTHLTHISEVKNLESELHIESQSETVIFESLRYVTLSWKLTHFEMNLNIWCEIDPIRQPWTFRIMVGRRKATITQTKCHNWQKEVDCVRSVVLRRYYPLLFHETWLINDGRSRI